MIKIHISRFPDMDGLGFYILNYSEHERKRSIARVDKEGYLQFEEMKEDYFKSPKPTFFISGWQQHEFFKAISEVIDEQGFKTDKESKIEGTLIATKYHLEDLRKLLKL